MIDEVSKRLPTFSEGVPVTLADGRRWHLRRPAIRVEPVMTAGEVTEVRVGLVGVPDYDGLCAVLYGEGGASAVRGWSVRFSIAVILLRGNYALSDSDYESLLSWSEGCPDSAAAWETIVQLLPRHRPKTRARRLMLAAALVGLTGEVDLSLACDLAGVLEWSGRLPPASQWIPAVRAAGELRRLEGMF